MKNFLLFQIQILSRRNRGPLYSWVTSEKTQVFNLTPLFMTYTSKPTFYFMLILSTIHILKATLPIFPILRTDFLFYLHHACHILF